jgi:hypothetical protein
MALVVRYVAVTCTKMLAFVGHCCIVPFTTCNGHVPFHEIALQTVILSGVFDSLLCAIGAVLLKQCILNT